MEQGHEREDRFALEAQVEETGDARFARCANL
jgi:hypothetical protein